MGDIVSPSNYPSYRSDYSVGGSMKSMDYVATESAAPMPSGGAINYTQNNVPSNINDKNYEVKSYSATIESANIEEDCNELLANLDPKITKKDNINITKHHCNFTIKVLK